MVKIKYLLSSLLLASSFLFGANAALAANADCNCSDRSQCTCTECDCPNCKK